MECGRGRKAGTAHATKVEATLQLKLDLQGRPSRSLHRAAPKPSQVLPSERGLDSRFPQRRMQTAC